MLHCVLYLGAAGHHVLVVIIKIVEKSNLENKPSCIILSSQWHLIFSVSIFQIVQCYSIYNLMTIGALTRYETILISNVNIMTSMSRQIIQQPELTKTTLRS